MDKVLRPAGAFAAGVVLNQVLTICFGLLAAVTIPKGYFAWFGAHKVIALCIEEAVVTALPTGLLAFLWARFTVRLVGLPRRQGVAWCLAGLVVARGVSEVLFAVEFEAMQAARGPPPATLLTSPLVAHVWAILSVLAPPLGVLAACFGGAKAPRGAAAAHAGKRRPLRARLNPSLGGAFHGVRQPLELTAPRVLLRS